jgi:hypothetical protein
MHTQPILNALRRIWSGREVGILAPAFNRSTEELADQVRRSGGAVRAYILGRATCGTIPGDPPIWSISARSDLPMERMAFELSLRSPTTALARWLDKVDPEHRLVLLGGVYTEVPNLRGRRVYGWRRPEWAQWEDKTHIDELFARADVPTPPYAIVSVDDPGIADRAAHLDAGLGIIVAIDCSSGYTGDAKGLRWVRDKQQLAEHISEARARSRRLRVAPFVEGVPCSILGLVARDGVAAFDPLEVVTLHDPDRQHLLFCGTSNRWRPPRESAETMREATRRAGAELARCADYRGFFSLDGILTDRGFVATELNPRHASGLGLRTAWPWFPDYLFHRAVQEREPDLWTLPTACIERTFRSVIAAAPSHQIAFPHDSPIEDGERTVSLWVGHTRYRIDYVTIGGSVSLRDVEPTPMPLGPVVAAFARHLGCSGLRSAAAADGFLT